MDTDRACSAYASQKSSPASTQGLAEAFQRSLNITPRFDTIAQAESCPLSQANLLPSGERQLGYNPSQHYTHSAHAINGLNPLQPAPHDIASRLLIQNDIAPSSLSKDQFALFQNAALDQQARLVMLWRLAPPGNSVAESEGSTLATQTTLEREEQLAWHRYREVMAGKKFEEANTAYELPWKGSEVKDEEMLSGS